MNAYPLVVTMLAWLTATAAAVAPGRPRRPAALFVVMHVVAVGAITVLVAAQTIHWGAIVLPFATLRSVFGVANEWSNEDAETSARVRGTAIKVPIVNLVWVAGWGITAAT